MMKLIKNGTIILIIGVIGLIAVIGTELYIYAVDRQPPKGYSAEEIAALKIEPVNINTASVDELSALPGLSEKQAQSIIDYREENGRVRSAEEIINIKGISENTYQKIALYITAE